MCCRAGRCGAPCSHTSHMRRGVQEGTTSSTPPRSLLHPSDGTGVAPSNPVVRAVPKEPVSVGRVNAPFAQRLGPGRVLVRDCRGHAPSLPGTVPPPATCCPSPTPALAQPGSWRAVWLPATASDLGHPQSHPRIGACRWAAFWPLSSLVEVGAASVLWMGKLTLVPALLVASDRNQPQLVLLAQPRLRSPEAQGIREGGKCSQQVSPSHHPCWPPVVVGQTGSGLQAALPARWPASGKECLFPTVRGKAGPAVLGSCARPCNSHHGGWGGVWAMDASLHPRALLSPQTTDSEGGVPKESRRMRLKDSGRRGPLTGSAKPARPHCPRWGRQDSKLSSGRGAAVQCCVLYSVLRLPLPRPVGPPGWNGGVRDAGCSHGIIKHRLPGRVLDQDAPLTPHLVVIKVTLQWQGSVDQVFFGVLRLHLIHLKSTQQTFAGPRCCRHDLSQAGDAAEHQLPQLTEACGRSRDVRSGAEQAVRELDSCKHLFLSVHRQGAPMCLY